MGFAVQEQDDIGVGLQIPGFPQVREIGPLVLAALQRAVELRQQHDAEALVLGELLEPAEISPTS